MSSFAYNISKGRMVELLNRVKSNEPANSAIIVIPLKASGTEAEGQDYDTVTEVLGGTAKEQTEGWSRKTLTDAELAAIAVDDTNNRFPATLPEIKWTAPTKENNTTGLLIAYDSDTTGGTDANLIPLVHVDFAVTADGNDVVFNPGDILRAS